MFALEQWISSHPQIAWAFVAAPFVLWLAADAVLLARLKTSFPDIFYAIGSPSAADRNTGWFFKLRRYKRSLPREVAGVYFVSRLFFYLAVALLSVMIVIAIAHAFGLGSFNH